MRLNKRWRLALVAMLAGVAAVPLLGQDKPESILPPGFGDPVEERQPATRPSDARKPADLIPDTALRLPVATPGAAGSPTDSSATDEGDATDESAETAEVVAELQDLPDFARRPIERVGVLGEGDGNMGAVAFGTSRGPYLASLMDAIAAPVASRWASIALRRALLSRVDTPGGIAAPDWVAARTTLLLRMGEAESARMLVQAVDADRYTQRLRAAALDTALATADPAAICPFADAGAAESKDARWGLARGMCAALAGESAQAGALIDAVRDRGSAKSIDVLLAEKIVGAGGNTRRAVNIQWEGVDELNPWRFGLASATALDLPAPLLAAAPPAVRAWRARAPLLSWQKRAPDAELAAALGVYSANALVDHYSAWSDETDSAESAGQPFTLLRLAFTGADSAARVSAMSQLWSGAGDNALTRYARMIVTARAAALLRPSSAIASDDRDQLIAAMLTAGYDLQANRWQAELDRGGLGWGLLALAAPRPGFALDSGEISGFDAGSSGQRAKFLFAGLAGLGRVDAAAVAGLADSMKVAIGRSDRWTRALGRAAARGERATVALLAAVGLQARDWNEVPPEHLYHIVAAMRIVGLEGEARMIAAEAVTRS